MLDSRQDLYYRINVFPVHMPSLAQRREDLAQLARSILQTLDSEKAYHLTESAMSLLKAHNYRGNIRELRNILSRAVVLANTNVIDPAVIRQCLAISEATPQPASNLTLKAMEEHYLRRLMQEHDDDKEKVAAIAGISVRSLYRKLQEANDAQGSI